MKLIKDWIQNAECIQIHKVDSLQRIVLEKYLTYTTEENDEIISTYILRRFGNVRFVVTPIFGVECERETELKLVLNYDLRVKENYICFDLKKEKPIVYFWHNLLNKKYNSWFDYCRECNINTSDFYHELVTYYSSLVNQ